MQSTLRTQQGFTLIELLIALAAGSLVMGAIYGVLVQQRNVYARHQQMLEMRQNVRLGARRDDQRHPNGWL